MEAVSTETDKVVKKQKIFHKAAVDNVEKLLTFLNQSQTVIGKNPALFNSNTTTKKLSDINSDLQNSVKDYYNALGKLGKALDKKFPHNLEHAGSTDAFEGQEKQLNEAVAYQFVREGNFDFCDMLCQESQLSLPQGLKSQFSDMFMILKSITEHDLKPALSWAEKHRELLEKRSSNLEFRLHQLQFIVLLTDQGLPIGHRTINALTYARKEFSKFGARHLKEIQKLMGCMAYTVPSPFKKTITSTDNPLLDSPYSEIFRQNMWSEIKDVFAREFCSLLGLAQDSPLMVTTNVGVSAIPTMIKLRNVVEERRKDRPKVEMWSVDNELPVEIPLHKKHRYHSIFACPVSREQTSASNPPFMLTCGHIISKESLLRLCKGGKGPAVLAGTNPAQGFQTSAGTGADMTDPMNIATDDPKAGIPQSAKIKCPYCPTESLVSQSIVVHF